MHTHKFTQSGLGQAPFTLSGVVDNCRSPAPGEAARPAGSCDHCYTGIRYEFHLLSADGVRSKVGSDCIKKAGDRGLISLANAERNRRSREDARAKRQAATEKEFARQRAFNGGHTDWEHREFERLRDLAIEQEKIAKALKILRPLAELLDDGKEYGFRAEVSRNLRAGTMQYGRAATLISEIIAKQTARKNSAEYQEVFTKIEAQLGKAREILK